ncbi:MAG TPA: DUF222 domain-containing protein [Longimicrobiales bacterium]|nr:DUF222 domain-containing protein [Longimicrobiales bacterium]
MATAPAPLRVWSGGFPEHPDPDLVEELGDEIRTLAAHGHAANHRLLVLIARFDALRGWEPGGFRSCAHWLSFHTGMDLGAAREHVRAARMLEDLPRTSASMARGELSFSKVRALTRVARPESEGALLELARGCTTEQLERQVRAWRRGSRQDEAAREQERHRSRTLSIFPDDDGMYVVRGRLTPEVGVVLLRAVEAAADALYRADPLPGEDTLAETTRLRADAVGLVAERALGAGFGRGRAGADELGDDPADDDAPISGTRAERYTALVFVEEAALRSEAEEEALRSTAEGAALRSEADVDVAPVSQNEISAEMRVGDTEAAASPALDGGRADRTSPETDAREPYAALRGPRRELADGTRLSHETARRLTCDCGVVRVTRTRAGSVLDVGRKTRSIPAALRRALEVRDRGCRFPGCGLPFTEGHHVEHWGDGGPTSLANCVLLCRYHHRLVHEGGWRLAWWGEGRPVFIDPRGREHFDAAWRAPSLPGDPVVALIRDNRRAGAAPGPTTASARWRREDDIPAGVLCEAWEAAG